MAKTATKEKIKSFKAYERDIEKLERLYGSPQWRAFRMALAKTDCDHPEGMRTYLDATIPAVGNEAITLTDHQVVSRFKCSACGRYFFPDVQSK